ncbi:hypothetical protein MBLNU230_g0998t1 [Neophaeotheca triangularis]
MRYATAFAALSALAQASPIHRRAPCDPQPPGAPGAPVPSPNTAAGFRNSAELEDLANNAPVPEGYEVAYSNLDASSNEPSGYLTFQAVNVYDPSVCAARCDSISGCQSFNIYFQRSPSIEPGFDECSDPGAVVYIHCGFWSSDISVANAVNTGQFRADFEVLISGSNGYNRVGEPETTTFEPTPEPTAEPIPTTTATVVDPEPTTETVIDPEPTETDTLPPVLPPVETETETVVPEPTQTLPPVEPPVLTETETVPLPEPTETLFPTETETVIPVPTVTETETVLPPVETETETVPPVDLPTETETLVTETETLPPIVTETETLPPIATETETLPPIVTETETLPPIATETETLPPIVTETETLPPIATETETLPPIVTETETLPPIVTETETLPPIVTETETLPPIVTETETETLPPFVTETETLITTTETLPPVVTGTETVPPVATETETETEAVPTLTTSLPGPGPTCAPQPPSAPGAPVIVPNTPAGFRDSAAIDDLSLNAPVPAGYSQTFENLDASNNAPGYLTYQEVGAYEPAVCAARCETLTGCLSFNIYLQRNPSVDPNSPECLNPPANVNIFCAFWSSDISVANANNFGQFRGDFQVLIGGANGYSRIDGPVGSEA